MNMMQIGLILRELKEVQIEPLSILEESIKKMRIENQRKMEELQNNMSKKQECVKDSRIIDEDTRNNREY